MRTKTVNTKDYHRKPVALIICICVTVPLLFGLLSLWLWTLRVVGATYYGNCENGLMILRYDKFLSYSYEVRDGLTVVEKGLRYKQMEEFAINNDCRIYSEGG